MGFSTNWVCRVQLRLMAMLIFFVTVHRVSGAIQVRVEKADLMKTTGAYDRMQVQIVVSGVAPSFLMDETTAQFGHLDVFVPTTQLQPILLENDGRIINAGIEVEESLFARYESGYLINDPDDPDFRVLGYTFSIYDSDGFAGALARLVINDALSLKVAFVDRQGTQRAYVESTAAVFAAVPTEPVVFKKEPTVGNNSVTFHWDPVTVIHSNGQSRQPTNLVFFIIDQQDNTLDLTTGLWDTAQATDIEPTETCQYQSNTLDGANCVLSCSGLHYLASTQADQRVRTELISYETGAATLTDLDPSKIYSVIIQHEKSSLRTCKVVQSIKTYSLAEATGGEDAKFSTQSCFIATLVFGGINTWQVQNFRWFRDHVLQSFSLGVSFVDMYYQHAESFTGFLEDKPMILGSLWVILEVMAIVIAFIRYMGVFGVLFSLALLLWFIKRRTKLFQIVRIKH